LIAAGIGAVAGFLAGQIKFKRPIAGALFGAALFFLTAYLFLRPPAHSVGVETADRFQKEVLQAAQPVLVDFYADWCPPCRAFAPVFQQLSEEYHGRAKFVKVDVDKSAALARMYEVRAIPTVMLFVKGKSARQWVGCVQAEPYRRALNAILAP